MQIPNLSFEKDGNDELDPMADWKWDGVSLVAIEPFVKIFQEHYPSIFKEWKVTVPTDFAEEVRVVFHQDPHNSESRKEIHFQIVAVDQSGMALTNRCQYYSYEDVDVPDFQVMELSEAIDLHKHYTDRRNRVDVDLENENVDKPSSKRFRPR